MESPGQFSAEINRLAGLRAETTASGEMFRDALRTTPVDVEGMRTALDQQAAASIRLSALAADHLIDEVLAKSPAARARFLEDFDRAGPRATSGRDTPDFRNGPGPRDRRGAPFPDRP